MTDGPLKSFTMGKHWTPFKKAVCREGFGDLESSQLGSGALLKEIMNDNTKSLVSTIKSCVSRRQLELDPSLEIEAIFSVHPREPFSETLERELLCLISLGYLPDVALDAAGPASVRRHLGVVERRFDDELAISHERGQLTPRELGAARARGTNAFSGIHVENVWNAVYGGKSSEFEMGKNRGIEDGPSLRD